MKTFLCALTGFNVALFFIDIYLGCSGWAALAGVCVAVNVFNLIQLR